MELLISIRVLISRSLMPLVRIYYTDGTADFDKNSNQPHFIAAD